MTLHKANAGKRLSLSTFAFVFLWVIAARADFEQGLEAFDGGDLEATVAEWRPLAEAGDIEAQVALAGLYLSGAGVPLDPAEAARWYRLAAERGDPVAQLNLGDLYSRGLGVRRDLVQAYLWLSLAIAQGRRWPETRRAEIVPFMSPEERARAATQVEAWRPAN